MLSTMLEKVRELRYNLGASHYPGYRLTEKSRAVWDKLEADKARMQAEWDARDAELQRQKVIDRVREMIEWAHVEYEAAKLKHDKNIKVLTELTLNWSPERVMSKHKDFTNLCRALQSEKIWKMLSRKERAFIADAVNR